MAIANADGSIVLTTKVDQSGLKKGMSTMKSGVSSLTGAFGKLAGVIGVAFSVDAIVRFSKESSKLAINTESSVQRLIDIYGSASQAVGDFIDANAQALGMSKAAAASYASVYGNLFSVWADQQTNAALTTKYLNMTAVVASKTGRTVEDVQERVRSGLLGNTEAIEDLGIFVNIKTIEMTDAFQRMANGKSWEQLDAYTQQQIRSLAILEQATEKYGDTVAQNNALTRAQYNAAFEEFKNTWGTVVNYVLMPVLQALTKVFQMATAALQAIFKISGKTINVDTAGLNEQEQSIGGAVDNQNDLTDAVKETNKEVKKSLAGFDDLQILAGNSANAVGVGFGEGVGVSAGKLEFTETDAVSPVDTTQYENLRKILQKISDLFMTGFWEGFQNADFSRIKESLIGIKKSILEIFTNPEVQGAALSFVSSVIMTFGQIAGSFASIGTTIATNVLGGFDIYLQTNAPFIQKSIASIFDASSGIATSVGNMWTAFANIFSVFAGTYGQQLTANIIGIFGNAGIGIAVLATKIGNDFISLLTQPIIENQDGLKLVLDGVLEFISTHTGSIKTSVDSLINEIIALWDNHVSPFIQKVAEVVTQLIDQFVESWNVHVKPVLDEFAAKFQTVVNENVVPMFERIFEYISKVIDLYLMPLWENVLEPLGKWIIDVFVQSFANAFSQIGDVFNNALNLISGVIDGIMETLIGVINFITGVFTGDWKLAWDGVLAIFKGIVNTIISLFEGMINFIVSSMNSLLGGINIGIGAVGGLFGKDWNIPEIPPVEIPRLAQGAVIPANREFLAILGDQKQGTNIETPLDTMVQAFTMALDRRVGYNGGNIEVILEVDGREFGKAVVEQGNIENRRIGTRLVVL